MTLKEKKYLPPSRFLLYLIELPEEWVSLHRPVLPTNYSQPVWIPDSSLQSFSTIRKEVLRQANMVVVVA